jgi:hypothetical protein
MNMRRFTVLAIAVAVRWLADDAGSYYIRHFAPMYLWPFRRYRLPLHLERGVRSTAFQRSDMIDHVSRAATIRRSGRRAGMQAFELILSLRASFIAAMAGRVGRRSEGTSHGCDLDWRRHRAGTTGKAEARQM